MKSFWIKCMALLLGLSMLNTSCVEQLAELNVNPNATSEINPDFVFTYSQLKVSGDRYENWRAMLIYSSTMIQHLSALAGYWTGDKYTYNGGYSSSLWDRHFPDAGKNLFNLRVILSEDPEDATKLAQVRIMSVLADHRVTDLYGDMPYSKAYRGFTDQIFKPSYDTQESIYAAMLTELEQAAAQLSASQDNFGAADILYGGDIDKWKKLANSLMLRLAMRMTKVDAAGAQAWAEKAMAGGVFTSNDDIAYMEHTAGPSGINMNGIGQVFQADDNQRLSASFIDRLAATGDPRLDIFGDLPGAQKGLPNGFDATTIQSYPGGDDLDTYSRVNPLLVDISSPMVFMTYAEVEFLLAEMATRNWGGMNPDQAKDHYEAGVRAGMQQWSIYDGSLAIDGADVDTWLTNNPYDAANAMEQIHEQYYIATFLNEYEAYANYRRTGYPVLVDVDYPGNEANGKIPRRLRYPGSEASVNAENYDAVLVQQGPDEFTT
ncbi:MAG: SusD/RagB family nutrient-binding outer membrane lipoprotein, partial [Bacteroidota bacterium]